uniref:Uncharacterized protein n=1 Tax=Setaria italica TaxID=4555 RepID=K3ZPT1_SETIT
MASGPPNYFTTVTTNHYLSDRLHTKLSHEGKRSENH